MKRSIKLVVCMLLVAIMALPSVFATGLGTSSYIVKVGTVDTTDVDYNVHVEWGSLVYNFVKSENGEGYEWQPRELLANRVTIRNNSNIIVNAKIEFASAIPSVIGMKESNLTGLLYSPLAEEPENFATGEYYKISEHGGFVKKDLNEEFEANKYYDVQGAGGAPALDGNIPAVSEIDGMVLVSSLECDLILEGGSLGDVRPGATIGTVTVTLS